MHLTFLSNYYTHHQKSLCEKWNQLTKQDFAFVETEEFDAERKHIGWTEDKNTIFVRKYSDIENKKLIEIIDDSDILILGSAPLHMIQNRLKSKKIVFKYSERIFKKGYCFLKWLPRVCRFWWFYGRHKNMFLLAASAYTTWDYVKHGTFAKKCYKWGYFPETKKYDKKELFEAKCERRILWCGRFLEWKHPEMAIKVAECLKQEGYQFNLEIIGSGELKSHLQSEIKERALTDYVKILDSMKPDEVRKHMEMAGVYIFTSDFQEGWGAVLNEAMNSGCAVVASHAIGSVPFMVEHGKNGLIYENNNFEDFYNKVKYLLDHPDEQRRLGSNAYHTIIDLWNAEIAAERFLKLANEIQNYGYCDLYDDGPCSRAKPIKNNWFKEENYDYKRIEC